MVSSPDASAGAATPTPASYVQKVREEKDRQSEYFRKQLSRYRVARIVVIVSATLVPVLAATPVVPRLVLGMLGAVAAIAEAVQELYQFRKTALNAMQTANALERALNKYMTSTRPYAGTENQVFNRFVEDVEAIRESADKAFLETWLQAASSSHQALPGGAALKPAVVPKAEGH
jgi:hypothetical protein